MFIHSKPKATHFKHKLLFIILKIHNYYLKTHSKVEIMRVHIYEDRQDLVNKLCKELEVSPTKLVNELITYLDERMCRNKKAKEEDDLFRRFNR